MNQIYPHKEGAEILAFFSHVLHSCELWHDSLQIAINAFTVFGDWRQCLILTIVMITFSPGAGKTNKRRKVYFVYFVLRITAIITACQRTFYNA